jgi:hypothetical protein
VRRASLSGRMPGGSGSSAARGASAVARDRSMSCSQEVLARSTTVSPEDAGLSAGSSWGTESTVGSPGSSPMYLHSRARISRVLACRRLTAYNREMVRTWQPRALREDSARRATLHAPAGSRDGVGNEQVCKAASYWTFRC